jgi:hypothetical protein
VPLWILFDIGLVIEEQGQLDFRIAGTIQYHLVEGVAVRVYVLRIPGTIRVFQYGSRNSDQKGLRPSS